MLQNDLLMVLSLGEIQLIEPLYGGFPKLGYPFWGPHNKDYSILGSIFGVPLFWEITKRSLQNLDAIHTNTHIFPFKFSI